MENAETSAKNNVNYSNLPKGKNGKKYLAYLVDKCKNDKPKSVSTKATYLLFD
ncbi:MAG: hypothetical protein ACXVED_18075 [Bacteroidia bacterium]